MAKRATAVPSKSESDYQAEDDHRTMTRAEEIRMDSKRMAGVKKMHRKQMRALGRMSRVIGNRR